MLGSPDDDNYPAFNRQPTEANMMNPSQEQTLETIQAMRRQEDCNGYCVSDYLSQIETIDAAKTALDTPVDASCRFVMANWCCEIAQFCNYKKETVAIAMNCLDRFMSTPDGRTILLDREKYQLAAMAALYSSVKIHEQEAMDPVLVSTLSRGVHTSAAVEAMEAKMLKALNWRWNPCTAMSFARIIINDLITDDLLNPHEKATILDIAKYQIEMTVNEYKFCTFQCSSVAFACILNAIESCCDDGMFCSNFAASVGKILLVDDVCVKDFRIAIYELLNGAENDTSQNMMNDNSIPTKESSSSCGSITSSDIHSSPRTVATSVGQ